MSIKINYALVCDMCAESFTIVGETREHVNTSDKMRLRRRAAHLAGWRRRRIPRGQDVALGDVCGGCLAVVKANEKPRANNAPGLEFQPAEEASLLERSGS